ncbi:unnamed protein product [Rhizoctonia solani]|uniref:F-box domain-containing protein n=1 Tax=Rhizoctonia solani TaxID=456999 RepID=A0A8H3GTB6_9AGAM|nr:unnamed protein product [Rhizoctonia solani]
MTSNAHLLPPEIIREIVSLSGNREQLDLAYTCKHFFSSIIPVIWENIRGVGLIIQLIPGVEIVKEYVEDDNGTVTDTLLHILIDESSLAEDWTRYWIYAPLVKHIAPFVSDERSHGDHLRVHGWRFLFMGLTGSPLLPNLLSIDTRRQNLSPWFDQLAWISLFMSPSLQEFYLGDVAWDEGSHDLLIRPFDLFLALISRIPSSNPSEIKPRRAEWYPSEDELALH